jgi:hypothetical protein
MSLIDMTSDPFWKDDLTILFDKQRLVEYIPTSDMTIKEKLNALTRMSIYLGILLTLIYKSSNPIYLPLITGAIIYLIHEHYPMTDQSGGHADTDMQMPSKDNPFMNVLISDYVDNPNKNPASNVEQSNIKQDIDTHFSDGLYKDVNNVWDKNNSQRQFYTNPSTTIPNDRDSFMKWCWNTPYTCKDGNLSRCMKFEDVRGHGQI